MTLLNHPLQRIPVGIGGQSLLTGQITTPRLQLTGIKSIALSPYLKEDSINAIFLQLIQLVSQGLLHTIPAYALELSIYTLNPSSTELPLGVLSYNCH